MKTTFKVSFYLRSNYENKEGKSPVMLRVFLGGEMANWGSTKVFVRKDLWSNSTSRLKGRTAEALNANATLDSISATLHEIYLLHSKDDYISLDKIKALYYGENKEFSTFLPILDKYIDEIAAQVGKTRSTDCLQKYSVLRKHFSKFLIHKYGRMDIGLLEFNIGVVKDFELYLLSEANCSVNTATKKLKTLKTIVLYAQAHNYMTINPFQGYKYQNTPVDRGFLTDEEILQIPRIAFLKVRHANSGLGE